MIFRENNPQARPNISDSKAEKYEVHFVIYPSEQGLAHGLPVPLYR